jgi:putative tricarboxylic transport membrane protein
MAGWPTAAIAAEPLFSHLRIVVPSGPGGGLDTTARALQLVMPSAGVARTSSVENVAGGAGLIGLTKFVSAERGANDVMLMGGSGVFGAALAFHSPITFADVTPIALLATEYEVVIVRSDSPYRTMADLIRAFRERPESLTWAGGQAGGVEQMAAWRIAAAVGIEPARVNFIPFAGGGEMMPALLGGQVSVGINYVVASKPYIEAGTVRALGVSTRQRIPLIDLPTLREQGVDGEFENWRALMGPPGLTAADRTRLESAAAAMASSPEWRDVLVRYGWADHFLTGPAFGRFLLDEETRVHEMVRRVGATAVGRTTAVGRYPAVVLVALGATALLFVTGTRARPARIEREGAGCGRLCRSRWRWRSASRRSSVLASCRQRQGCSGPLQERSTPDIRSEMPGGRRGCRSARTCCSRGSSTCRYRLASWPAGCNQRRCRRRSCCGTGSSAP